MTETELRDILQMLCVTIGSRSIGTAGERRAAEYVAQRFREFGWESRLEEYPCLAWDYQGSSVTIDGRAVHAGPTHYSPGGVFEGPLMRARIGEDQLPIIDDYRGRIAWFCEKEAGLFARHQVCRELRNQGAVAVLILSYLTETWSTKIVREPDIGIPTFGVAGREAQVLEAAEGRPVRLTVGAQTRPSHSENVVATVPGGPVGPLVLVTAHHEAAPYCPGAMDNASGVAMVLAIAQRFGRSSHAPRMMLATTGGHEYGGANACGRGAIALFQEHKQLFLASGAFQLNFDGMNKGEDEVMTCANCSDAFLARLRSAAVVPVRPEPFVGVDAMPWCQWKLPVMWPVHNVVSDVYHSPLDTSDRIDFAALADGAARHCDLLEKLMA